MKKSIFTIAFCLIASQVFAFNLATGKDGGMYAKIGTYYLPKQLDNRVPLNCTNTLGSAANGDLLKSGAVDGAVIQADYLAQHPELNVEVVAELYDEYVFLLAQKDSGIKSVKDLTDKSKIATDRADSGTQITWASFCAQDKSYKSIPTEPLAGTIAQSKLRSGDISAVMFVSGVGGADIARANQSNDLRLVNVDDWDFDNAKYKGKKIYKFVKVGSDSYPNLFPGMFNSNVETIAVPALFVVRSEWAAEHQGEFDNLYDAVQKMSTVVRADQKKIAEGK